ncbi:TonB-dependent siderophore receptor [Rhizobium sp. 16-528-1A]|uniref:TonB-dependent siderophore receptor n=1 Tax=Rhizobium sp. 16-488-2a TaxID=2819990 RepID=UPI001ADC3382|nr:TonB-dependent siderophore receptor [Rhizobium sp. 16-488-2b]MBO9178272.1 TonB-dependent siderophore receptor [Rhizobium sp. 16-488-2a]
MLRFSGPNKLLATALVASVAAISVLSSQPALAQQSTTNRFQSGSYNIPAQPLSSALASFARTSGLKIAYPAAITQGKTSSTTVGPYTPTGALKQILSGSGLSYRFTGDNAVTVFDPSLMDAGRSDIQGATALEPLVVTGNRGTTEGTGSYTTGEMATATGLPLSIRETPQSVSVISHQRIEDQDLRSVEDVVVNSPGVIFKKKGIADDNDKGLFARGLEIENFQVDGVNVNKNLNSLSLDTEIYDHIEIVRGATGLLSGAGSPSATVNLVRKRPTSEFQASVEGTIGSWNTHRGTFDVGGPISDDGGLRGRAVGAFQEGDSYIDRLTQKSQALYGVLEADVGDNSMLTFGGEYQNKECRACGYFGAPAYFSDGTPAVFDRSFNSAANWSRQDRTRYSGFIEFEHEFDNDWKLTATGTYIYENNDRTYGWFSRNGYADKDTGAGSSLWVAKWPIPTKQASFDARVEGPMEMFGREHDLVFGVNASRTRADYDMYPLWTVPGFNASIPNIFDWNGDFAEPEWPTTGKRYYTLTQYSAYGATRLKPTDELSVILGSRINWYDQDSTYDYIAWGPYPDAIKENGVWVPYAGVVYDITDSLSAYASYTSIFQPQSVMDVSGQTLQPVTGDTYEIGMKAALFDERLNASVALFRTKQDNYAVADGNLTPTGDDAYVAANGAVIRGIEFELSGEILPDWQMQASFTHASTELPDGFSMSVGIPQNSMKLFTSYRLPGEWEKLTIGGGVRWESSSSFTQKNSTFPRGVTTKQDAFFVVDLMAKYDFNEKVTAKLNIHNLFDKKYYASTNIYSNVYGDPFNATLSLNYKF